MKKIILSTSLLLMFTLSSIAQNPIQTKVDSSYYSLAFGINFIDNSNGGGIPFEYNNLDFKTPFFLTAERKFKNNWSVALSLSTNQLELDRDSDRKIESYLGADIFANLFIDQILFNSERIDFYVGLGAGLHTIQANTAGTINFTGGFRYWFTEQYAFNFQGIGKVNKNGIDLVGNHYQFNLGISIKLKKCECDEKVLDPSEENLTIEQDQAVTSLKIVENSKAK